MKELDLIVNQLEITYDELTELLKQYEEEIK